MADVHGLPLAAGTALQARAGARGDVYLNGRFLTQRSSGVQRFARQLVLALDAELARAPAGGRRWVLLVPRGAAELPRLQRIEVRCVQRGSGHLWDQLLRYACRPDDILVNLANSGPVLRARSLSILHDAAVYRTPRNFSRAYRLFHQTLGRLLALRSVIGTVSHFSRAELSASLGLDAKRIFVVPNSCDHIHAVTPDRSVLDRLDLVPGRYFLAIGSPVPNKNLRLAFDAFAALDDAGYRLVVVGAVDRTVFGDAITAAPRGVVLAGALPDGQVAALLGDATALVFPSLYEGFGIPPLEAMASRCPVIASSIPAVVEVCGDAALYFDPADARSLTRALRRALAEPELLAEFVIRGQARAALYSWQRSARLLLEAVERMG